MACDHNLYVSKIRVKLKAQSSAPTHYKIDSKKLKAQATKAKFQVELKNRFEALRNMNENIADV